MRSRARLFFVALLLAALFLRPAGAGEAARRVVSLAPSITETLFALGAGPQVVGVTTFCLYPPEAQAIAKVGEYQALSAEAIAGLRPDLVALAEEHRPIVPQLDAIGLAWVMVDHRSLAGLLDSFDTLGQRTGHAEEAQALRARLEGEWDAVRRRVANRPRVKTLVVIGREYGTGAPARLYIAGRDRLYSDLLAIAGAENAYAGALPFPQLSVEGLLALAPDAVIELLPAHTGPLAVAPETARADWERVPELPAVRDGRLFFLTENRAYVPGPRWGELAEHFARLLHPEAFADETKETGETE